MRHAIHETAQKVQDETGVVLCISMYLYVCVRVGEL